MQVVSRVCALACKGHLGGMHRHGAEHAGVCMGWREMSLPDSQLADQPLAFPSSMDGEGDGMSLDTLVFRGASSGFLKWHLYKVT